MPSVPSSPPAQAPPVAGRWTRRLAQLGLALLVASAAQFLGFVIDGLRAADAVGFKPPMSDRLRQVTQGANTLTALFVLLAVLFVLLPELISGVIAARTGLLGFVVTAAAALGAVYVVIAVLGLYLQLVAPGSFKALAVLSRLANVALSGAAAWTAFTALADGRLAPRLGRFAPKS